MRITPKLVDTCIDTIAAICRNPSLREYIIGFTALDAVEKGNHYRRIGFDHLVVLADKMNRPSALDLEGRIQSRIFSGENRKLFNKYHAEKRVNGHVYQSYGGSPRDGADLNQSVYMVWWEE